MNFLIKVMKAIHFSLGISMPEKSQEKMVALLWIGILAAIAALAVGFTLFIVPYVIK
jgi:hypothetical protein